MDHGDGAPVARVTSAAIAVILIVAFVVMFSVAWG